MLVGLAKHVPTSLVFFIESVCQSGGYLCLFKSRTIYKGFNVLSRTRRTLISPPLCIVDSSKRDYDKADFRGGDIVRTSVVRIRQSSSYCAGLPHSVEVTSVWQCTLNEVALSMSYGS